MFLLGANKKKNVQRLKILSFLVPALLFFGKVKTAHAVLPVVAYGLWATGAAVTGWLAKNAIGNTVVFAFKWLLYGIFTMFGWVASLAISIFEWAIRPEDVALLFNNPGVYESWKFVRDFFNLFFILVLLYIAFTVIFQINKDFKKALLSLVLAALFINFSFPVSRFLIDTTNVPMYFFANQMMARDTKQGPGVLGGVMTASHIQGILIPGAEKGGDFDTDKVEVARLLMAIVFMFIFSITLLVLSIMFVIRLVALVVLVIFSPVGFAASIIPGMGQYSKMWWDNFWKYALFGPAAMLMILVATRFFAAIGNDSGALMNSMKTITAGTTVASEQTFFASMALFTIPIIMLWMAMGLAQKMSIAGASSVVGLGQKFSKWVGKLPLRGAWAATKWGGRKVDTHVLAKRGLSPKAWIGGIKGYFETQEHEDKRTIDLAKGRVHNKMNKAAMAVLPWAHEDKVNREFLVQQTHIREEEEELKQRSGGTINEDTGRVGLNEGKAEHDGAKVVGSMATLAKTNGLDNVVGDHWKDYIEKNADGSLAKKSDGTWKSMMIDVRQADGSIKKEEIIKSRLENGKVKVSKTENFNTVFKAMLEDAGVKDEETQARHLYNVGEVAKANGDFSYADRAQLDMASGNFRVRGTDDGEHAEAAIRQIHKMEPQAITRQAHGRTIADQDVVVNESVVLGIDLEKDKAAEKTEWGDAHQLAVQFIEEANANIVDQANRTKPEFSAAIKSMWDKANSDNQDVRDEVTKFIKAYNDKKNANGRKLVQKLIGKSIKSSDADPGLIPKIGSSRTSSGTAGTSGGRKPYAEGRDADSLKIV